MAISDTLGIIGNTPLVKLDSFDVGKSRLLLKLESANPGGSIKDRVALSMVEAAERDGKIAPGGTLIEATSGDTGIGLAVVAAKRGYKLLLVLPDNVGPEKITHLKALGATVILTRSDVERGNPEHFYDYAKRLSQGIPNSYFLDQFSNPANALAHELSTAPEIWAQTNHSVDAIIVGVGSGGTLNGLSKFFKSAKPQLEFVLVRTKGLGLGAEQRDSSKQDFGDYDLSLVRDSYSIPSEESYKIARALLRYEGILAGPSTGSLIAAAMRYAQEQETPKTIVTFASDSGSNYLNSVFNDHWLASQGLESRRQVSGTVNDLIESKYEDRSVIVARSAERLVNVYNRMKIHNVSQVPVVDDGKIVGILDEYDILLAVSDGNVERFNSPVSSFMTSKLQTVPPAAPTESILPLLKNGLSAVIKDDKRFYGLITKADYLDYLRRKLPNG